MRRTKRLEVSAGQPPAPELRLSFVCGDPGARRFVARGAGGGWVTIPTRRIPFLCPAGVEHRRYWRLFAPTPGTPHGQGVACYHTSRLIIDPRLRAALAPDELEALLAGG